MIICVAQGEGAEQDVEQANDHSEQDEVCNTELHHVQLVF